MNDIALRFRVDDAGWVPAAQRAPSPNVDARPDGVAPSLVVLHNISLPPGKFDGDAIVALFQNRLDCDAHPYYDAHLRGLRVSSHFLIRRDGMLIQFASCDARAWHAGMSDFFGTPRCNDFSIGIELEGTDDVAFEAPQYRTLVALSGELAVRYPIGAFVGHADIAPTRKTDPGPHFDWTRFARDTGFPARYFPYLNS